MHKINVDNKAMNQQVAPFLAIYLVSTAIISNLDKIDKLSKNQ
jgi:hypothetical protein